MANMAFAVPIQPGKTEAWKQFMSEIGGSRWEDVQALAGSVGLERARGWLQTTPNGDMAVLVLEGPGAHKWRQTVATSDHPAAKWLREMAENVYGVGTGPFTEPQPVEHHLDVSVKG
jgi:hypothetical protein